MSLIAFPGQQTKEIQSIDGSSLNLGEYLKERLEEDDEDVASLSDDAVFDILSMVYNRQVASMFQCLLCSYSVESPDKLPEPGH